MNRSISKPRAVVSTKGDVLIIPGSASPILFIPRTHVTDLLNARPQSAAIVISDVGAAAVETFLAAGASFDAATVFAKKGEIESVTIRFALPNRLIGIWTSDDALAADRARLRSLGFDLAVTNSHINWERSHAVLIGEMVSHIPTLPPQFVSLQHLHPERLAELVRDADRQNDTDTSHE